MSDGMHRMYAEPRSMTVANLGSEELPDGVPTDSFDEALVLGDLRNDVWEGGRNDTSEEEQYR